MVQVTWSGPALSCNSQSSAQSVRHQPNNVHPHFFKSGQMLLRRFEGSFLRILPNIELIKRRTLAPLRVLDFNVRSGFIRIQVSRGNLGFSSARE
jgi:hypothetical protein